jgi:hypothetical protein
MGSKCADRRAEGPKDDAVADTQVDPVAETQVEAGCSQRF